MSAESVLREIAVLARLASDMECPDAHGEVLELLGVDYVGPLDVSLEKRSRLAFKEIARRAVNEADRIHCFGKDCGMP